MRRRNGAGVGNEAPRLGAFPAFERCRSAPQQTSSVPCSPRFGSEVGQGLHQLVPSVVPKDDGEKVGEPFVAPGLLKPQQPCAPHVVEAHWGPPCPSQMWGAKPLTMGAVLSMAGDKSPGWIHLHPQQREVGSTSAWHVLHGGQALLCGCFSPMV